MYISIVIIAVLMLLPLNASVSVPEIEMEKSLVIVENVLAAQPVSDKSVYCSCIVAARMVMPDLARYAFARDIPANLSQNDLKVGDAILFNYPSVPEGHIAVIGKFVEGGWISNNEGNYERCKKTERFISYDDPFIRGFHRAQSVNK